MIDFLQQFQTVIKALFATLSTRLVAALGFMSGGVLMGLIDKELPHHLHPEPSISRSEEIKFFWQRCTLLILPIIIHYIPEGPAASLPLGGKEWGRAFLAVHKIKSYPFAGNEGSFS